MISLRPLLALASLLLLPGALGTACGSVETGELPISVGENDLSDEPFARPTPDAAGATPVLVWFVPDGAGGVRTEVASVGEDLEETLPAARQLTLPAPPSSDLVIEREAGLRAASALILLLNERPAPGPIELTHHDVVAASTRLLVWLEEEVTLEQASAWQHRGGLERGFHLLALWDARFVDEGLAQVQTPSSVGIEVRSASPFLPVWTGAPIHVDGNTVLFSTGEQDRWAGCEAESLEEAAACQEGCAELDPWRTGEVEDGCLASPHDDPQECIDAAEKPWLECQQGCGTALSQDRQGC